MSTKQSSNIYAGLLLSAVCWAGCWLFPRQGPTLPNTSGVNTVQYEMELADPVHSELTNHNYSVILSLDANGFPEEYKLSLQTPVCLDSICKLLEVTLFWDALGNYTRLEYPAKTPLTKRDHTPFSLEDYDRLDEILKDKKSILGTYPLGFFVTPPDPDKQGVDAVASATPQAVQAAVISGAAYTSWVLWRRVNGEITDRLLAMTLSHCSADYLNRCLLSDDSRFVQFALQHLLDKNLYDVRYREACFRILGKSGRTICQLTLQYLVAQVPDLGELNMRLTELIGVNDGSSRLILDYFERLSDAPPALWIQTAAQLGQVHTYYDVNAVLNLLKRRGGDSEAVRLEVVKLLQSEDRFIARRAQEFLGAQQ